MELGWPVEFLESAADLEEFCVRNIAELTAAPASFHNDDQVYIKAHCGDDVISLGTKEYHRRVNAIINCLGGIPSEGTNLASSIGGIYCEAHLVKGVCTDPWSVIEYCDIIRIKSLCKPDGARLPHIKEVPPFWTRGDAAAATIKWYPFGSDERNFAARWLQLTNRGHLSHLIAKGLCPYLPKIFGGLNYPVSDKSVVGVGVSKHLHDIIVELASDKRLLTPLMIAEMEPLGRLWTLDEAASEYAAQDHQQLLNFASKINMSSIDITDLSAELDLTIREIRFRQKFSSRFTSNGETYISVLGALTEVRMRLIGNRGLLQSVPVIGDVPNLSKIARRFKEIVGQIKPSPLQVEVFSEYGDLVDAAVRNYEYKREIFVKESLVDSFISDLCAVVY
jgi:hypothetical protein